MAEIFWCFVKILQLDSHFASDVVICASKIVLQQTADCTATVNGPISNPAVSHKSTGRWKILDKGALFLLVDNVDDRKIKRKYSNLLVYQQLKSNSPARV